MRVGRRAPADLVRWYPAVWRDRYGEELVAMIEDDLDGRPATFRYRGALVVTGLRERARAGIGPVDGAASDGRLRAGALTVLGAWGALVVGAATFAKVSEHVERAARAPGHPLAVTAHAIVVVAAACGAALLAVAAAAAAPAALRFLRAGGWSAVRRPVLVATVLTVVAVAATVGLSQWAHHLDDHQRNGGDGAYATVFVGWAVLVATTVGAWCGAVIAVARRIELDRALLRIEGCLAIAVTSAVAVATAAVGVWWAAMARGAPWFLAGTAPGTHPAAVTLPFVVLGAWLVLTTVVASLGALQVTRALRSA